MTLEIEQNGELHVDVIFQQGGVIDLGTKARPWDIGDKGWGMPGAPSSVLRKNRFGPPDAQET